jgi:hypothetical protein
MDTFTDLKRLAKSPIRFITSMYFVGYPWIASILSTVNISCFMFWKKAQCSFVIFKFVQRTIVS